MRDNEEFVVDSIQEHRGDVTRLTSLEFRIRWLGYDATHNTWEPWKGFHNSHKELRHPLFQVGLKEGTAAEKQAFASSDFMESGTLGEWLSLPEDEEYIYTSQIASDKPYFFHNVCRGFLGKQGLQ